MAGIRFLSDVGEQDQELGNEDVVIMPAFGVTVEEMLRLTERGYAATRKRGGTETRPDNTVYNQTVSPPEQVAMLGAFGGGRGFDNAAIPLGKRISGNFTGTTDEILRWGACKWGFEEDFVRAQGNGQVTLDPRVEQRR